VFSPSVDRGTDFACATPRFATLWPGLFWPVFRFQVKAGKSYLSGVKIDLTTLDYWLQRSEIEPVVLIHYSDADADAIVPDYFLIIREWALGHLRDIRNALKFRRAVNIGPMALRRIRKGDIDPFLKALTEEAARVSGLAKKLLTTNHQHIPEYLFLRRFPQTLRYWELPLLADSRAEAIQMALNAFSSIRPPSELAKVLAPVREHHPVTRCPPAELERLQEKMYRALVRFNSGRNFCLGRRFTAVDVAVGRAMASKYPGLWEPVSVVIRNWKRRWSEVLPALQLAGVLAQFDLRAEGEVVTLLRSVHREMSSVMVVDFWTYRLAHHINEVLAEVTGDAEYGRKAVEISAEWPTYEMAHLACYGWGIGQHVISWYETAARNPSLRGRKLQTYNRLMAEQMSELISG
jgi:hypothetical protein